MALEARGVSLESQGPQIWSVVGREERDCFFVLSVGEMAGFVCRTRTGAGEEGWGSPGGS